MHSMIIVELLWLNVLCLVLLRPPVRVMASNLEIPSSDEGFQAPSSDDGGDFPAAPEQLLPAASRVRSYDQPRPLWLPAGHR